MSLVIFLFAKVSAIFLSAKSVGKKCLSCDYSNQYYSNKERLLETNTSENYGLQSDLSTEEEEPL